MTTFAQRKNSQGEIPLLISSKANHLEVGKCLVERYGIGVDQPTKLRNLGSYTEKCEAIALHDVVILCHEDMVQYLAEDCKADVNVKTKTMFSNSVEFGGNTPLHLNVMCLEGTLQQNIIRLLILADSDRNDKRRGPSADYQQTAQLFRPSAIVDSRLRETTLRNKRDHVTE